MYIKQYFFYFGVQNYEFIFDKTPFFEIKSKENDNQCKSQLRFKN